MKKISFVIVILLAVMTLAVQAAKRAADDAPAASVTVSPADILAQGGDITAAVNAAVEGKNVKDILIFLAKNGEYTVSGSIVTAAPLTIKGNYAVIDASGFSGDLITLSGTETLAVKKDGTDSDHKLIASVEIAQVTVKGLKGALITDAQKTLVEKVVIDDATIEMPASNKNVLNFNGKGYVGAVTVRNSTIFAKDKNTGFFAQYGSRPKNVNEDWLQTFDIQNSTFVNIANGKNFNNLKQNGTDKNGYVLKNNIFVDCGKNGQVVVGLNNGQTSATPAWEVSGNIFNFGGADTSAAETSKAGKKDGADIVKNSIEGTVEFESIEDGLLNGVVECVYALALSSQPGDPEWVLILGQVATDVVLSPAEGELTAAVEEACKGKVAKSITINLAKDGKYTVAAPFFISCPLVINGAEGAEIDASGNPDQFILMRPVSKDADLNDKGACEIKDIAIKDVKITGLKNRLFYANRQDYLIGKLAVENSVLQFDGSIPRSIFDFYCGGNYEELSIVNSTLYADPSNAMRGGLLSTQSSKSVIELGGESQKLSIKNSTLYNIAKGMTPVLQQRHSQYYLNFELTGNVIVNCGEKGNFVAGLNEGQKSSEVKWAVANNAFSFDGENSGSSEAYGNAVPGPVKFSNPAAGDFTINILSELFNRQVGDPRWLNGNEDNLLLTIASGKDIAAEIAAAKGENNPGSILVVLESNGTYTVGEPIEVAGSIVINGNGATIDASAITGDNAVVKMPSGVTEPTAVDEVAFNDVNMKIATRLFYANRSKFWIKKLSVDNSVIAVDGTFKKSIFDCNGGGNVKLLSVNNSTIYANPKIGQNGGFFSSQSSQKPTEFGEGETQTFQITNSTLYNITNGNDMVTLREKDKEYMSFIVKNNVIVNCGKNGQFFKGLAGASDAKKATWDVDGNALNWGGADVSGTETVKGTNDEVKNSIEGIVEFENAEEGDFTLAYKSAQNEAKIGDPRWIVVPEDVKVTIASGDISAALDEALAKVKVVKDIRINLTDGGEYTISKSIVVPNSLYIVTGDIMAWEQQNATIDASGLEGPMITTPAEAPGEWVKGQILVDDVTVKGLKKALFASAAKNYFYEQFCIWGSVIEVAADVTTLDFTKGSVASLMISSSTIYAPTATTKAFYSSQSGQKATEYADGTEQQFIIFGSTLYNLAPGKNFFTHRQANQTWLTYNLQNNIFVNCGKSGQVVKGVNGGQNGKNPKWMIVSNLFNYDGKDTSAEESTGDADEPVEKSIPGVVTFADAAAGDFNATVTLAEGAEKPAGAGDGYHWKITYSEATAIETVKTAEETSLENAVIYNLNGQRIDKAQAKSGVFIVNGKKVVIK